MCVCAGRICFRAGSGPDKFFPLLVGPVGVGKSLRTGDKVIVAESITAAAINVYSTKMEGACRSCLIKPIVVYFHAAAAVIEVYSAGGGFDFAADIIKEVIADHISRGGDISSGIKGAGIGH